VNGPSTTISADAKTAIVAFLRRTKKARFATELSAAMQRQKLTADEVERALSDLQAENTVMVRDHFCADPHLAGVDLRIAALVESIDGADAQLSAIHEIDSAWDKWLASYLANHRCG
jgi:hypothetical protein